MDGVLVSLKSSTSQLLGPQRAGRWCGPKSLPTRPSLPPGGGPRTLQVLALARVSHPDRSGSLVPEDSGPSLGDLRPAESQDRKDSPRPHPLPKPAKTLSKAQREIFKNKNAPPTTS